tara:strand:+ start:2334 stop:3167 length:834 start_codon:yes stop_codon:yes gene_type:complete
MQIDESDIWTGSFNRTDKIDTSIREQFLREGYSIIRNAYDTQFIQDLFTVYRNEHAEKLNPEPTEKTNLVGHNRRAFSLDVKGTFNETKIYANQNVYPLIEDMLGEHLIIGSYGSVVSMPKSNNQHVHYDHPRLFLDSDLESLGGNLPPYAIHLFIPLVKVNENNGRTKIWPGSHHLPSSKKDLLIKEGESVESDLNIGDCLILDYRTLHAGIGNNSCQIRPLIYVIYQRAWFRDQVNYTHHESLLITEEELTKVPSQYQHLFSWKLDKYWGAIEKR